MTKINLKRVYEDVEKEDGIRILVDRLWPRGMSKEDAKLEHWLKELAPSNDLRKDLHDNKITFQTFKKQYKEELESGEQAKALSKLEEINKKAKQPITLLFAAKDEKKNNAQVIKELI